MRKVLAAISFSSYMGFFLTDKVLVYTVEEPRFHLFQRI